MSKLFGNKNHDFEIESLQYHNEYRREHGAPPLVLNKELCKISQRWAEELAKRDEMQYSYNDKFGENVFCGRAKTPDVKITAQDCIDKWYSEIDQYSFGREPTVLKCGHFTQIVWKKTKELGVGRAKSKSGKVYIVANYYPPGNYSGQFSNNVPPPGAFQFSPSTSSISQQESFSTPYSGSTIAAESTHSKLDRDIDNETTTVPDATQDKKFEHIQQFEEECLLAHNKYRSLHGAPPLKLNHNISAYAKEWADHLVQTNKLEHRVQDKYGENVFYAWSNDPNFVVSGNDPVDKWYSEIKDYDFESEQNDLGTGHFTQIIWRSSEEFGVAMARSDEGKTFVVANYYPPGNFLGKFKKNVPPVSKHIFQNY